MLIHTTAVARRTKTTAVSTPAPTRSFIVTGGNGLASIGFPPAFGSPTLVPPVAFVTGAPAPSDAINRLVKALSTFICCPAPEGPSYAPLVQRNPQVAVAKPFMFATSAHESAAAAALVLRALRMGS